jgi:hypothetical protein
LSYKGNSIGRQGNFSLARLSQLAVVFQGIEHQTACKLLVDKSATLENAYSEDFGHCAFWCGLATVGRMFLRCSRRLKEGKPHRMQLNTLRLRLPNQPPPKIAPAQVLYKESAAIVL